MGYDINKAGTLRLLLNGNLVTYANAVEQLGGEKYANDLEFGAVRADGKFYRMDQWREKTGIYEHTIRRRLKNGWTMLDAVNTPGSGWRCSPSDETRARTQGRPAKLFQCGDKALTLAQWAEDQNIPLTTLRHRLDAGWRLERALSEGIGHSRAGVPLSEVKSLKELVEELSKEVSGLSMRVAGLEKELLGRTP